MTGNCAKITFLGRQVKVCRYLKEVAVRVVHHDVELRQFRSRVFLFPVPGWLISYSVRLSEASYSTIECVIASNTLLGFCMTETIV